jgi:glc operon protein GlcG
LPLSLDRALRIIAAARAEAGRLGLRVTIAVVDHAGVLVALARMDGAPAMTVKGSEGKARASAAYGLPSGELKGASEEAANVEVLDSGPIVAYPGGLPISQDGVLQGALGIGGAKPDEDERCARAGLSDAGSSTT